MFVVRIESSWFDPETKQNKIKAGKLNLVDLAGSECISKTNAVGERKEEGIKINLSLSTLRNPFAVYKLKIFRWCHYRSP